MQIKSQVLKGMILGVAVALLAPITLSLWGGTTKVDPVVIEGKIKANLYQLGKWGDVRLVAFDPDSSSKISAKNDGLFYTAAFAKEVLAGKNGFMLMTASHSEAPGYFRTTDVNARFHGPHLDSIKKYDYALTGQMEVALSSDEKEKLTAKFHELYFAITDATRTK